jgi:hypothetical protein
MRVGREVRRRQDRPDHNLRGKSQAPTATARDHYGQTTSVLVAMLLSGRQVAATWSPPGPHDHARQH